MKSNIEVAQVLIRKAEGDLRTAKRNLDANEDLDLACYHCQQAGEKFLKAFLESHDVDYPFIHNLTNLIPLCSKLDPAFGTLAEMAANLTNYSVTIRYDDIIIPLSSDARRSYDEAIMIKEFVVIRLPRELTNPLSK